MLIVLMNLQPLLCFCVMRLQRSWRSAVGGGRGSGGTDFPAGVRKMRTCAGIKRIGHCSVVATPLSSPPSRHGNQCVFQFDTSKGGPGVNAVRANPLLTPTHTHTQALPAAFCNLALISCSCTFILLHSCDAVAGTF